eukprot:SAG31_NODE_150_length_22290_cov_5.975801_4_plen_116_part_00
MSHDWSPRRKVEQFLRAVAYHVGANGEDIAVTPHLEQQLHHSIATVLGGDQPVQKPERARVNVGTEVAETQSVSVSSSQCWLLERWLLENDTAHVNVGTEVAEAQSAQSAQSAHR